MTNEKSRLGEVIDRIDEVHAMLCYLTASSPNENLCESAHHGFCLIVQHIRVELQSMRKVVSTEWEGES